MGKIYQYTILLSESNVLQIRMRNTNSVPKRIVYFLIKDIAFQELFLAFDLGYIRRVIVLHQRLD